MIENKRFTVVMNEFDEVEYITDIIDCEDRDFADFIDFVNEMAKENMELKQQTQVKKVLKEQLDYYLERALLLNQPYCDVTKAIHDIADELGVDL